MQCSRTAPPGAWLLNMGQRVWGFTYFLHSLRPPPPAHFCIRPLDEQLFNGRRVRHSAPTSIPAPVATQPNPAGNPLSSFTMPRLSNEFPTKLWPTERAREREEKTEHQWRQQWVCLIRENRKNRKNPENVRGKTGKRATSKGFHSLAFSPSLLSLSPRLCHSNLTVSTSVFCFSSAFYLVWRFN